MKHWFVFFLALASVGTVKGQQTPDFITFLRHHIARIENQ